MNRFLLLLFSLLSFQLVFAQAVDAPFYYFGSKKIYLTESNDRIYVRLSAADARTVKARLRSRFPLSDNAVITTGEERFLVIKLSEDKITGRQKEVIGFIKTIPTAELVRPALKAKDGKEVIIDEVFYVKLKPGTDSNQLKRFAVQNRCVPVMQYRYDKRTFLIRATAANGYDGLKMANLFYESGLFEYAEPDFRAFDILHEAAPPNDPLFNLQWSHVNDGSAAQFNGTAGADMDVDEAWAVTMGSPSIRIAVLDEGVQRNHPDLVNNIDPLGFGLTAGNALTGDILSTSRSHGTSCAGIIAADANNGIGIAGIAPLCKIIPVNITINTAGVFGTSAQIAQAIDWAWNEGAADILSNSWGGGTASSLIRDAIIRATTLGRGGKGAVVLFSSGNNDAGLANPAIFPETIAVGAMSMCYQRKSAASCDAETFWGSNYGVGLDISAPGVKIATTRVTGTGTAPNPDYNLTFNGTSSACPMVAGVAALVLSVNNNFTQVQLRQILERSVTKGGGYSYNRVTGQPNGTWSSELGYGMVNAKNAVLAAQNPQYCKVETAAAGSLQVCNGSSVSLQVVNPLAGVTYEWRLNGSTTATGSSVNANQTGSWDVVLTTATGCKDTSAAYSVLVSSSQGALLANAGTDQTVCAGTAAFLGGNISATGGTSMLNPMRGLAVDYSNNQFVRFNPLQPVLEHQVIADNFIPNFAGGNFYSGAASTPDGLYMIGRGDRTLVKVDTATGQLFTIGVATTNSSILFNGMTYDATTDKLFAVAAVGTANQLFEINKLTGAATLLGNITGIPAAVTLASIGAANNGQLYAMRLVTTVNSSSVFYSIDKVTRVATVIGNTGFLSNFAAGGDVDPVTDIFYQFANSNPTGLSSSAFSGKGLWVLNKTTGQATLTGSIGFPFNAIDALTFAKPEYSYQWSPATHLSNANDANPQFLTTVPGTYTYTITVTDLCGNTATDEVVITVPNPPVIPVIIPAAPVLSHRNAFTETLRYTKESGIGYQWFVDAVAQPNSTDTFAVNYLNSTSNRYSVKATDPVSGCTSNATDVQFTYSTGVLMNTSAALTVCDSSFYDAGGPTGNTSSSFTRTFTPATAGSKLKLSIYNLALSGSAYIRIYDGTTTSAPVIATLRSTANGSVTKTYMASNADGILTVSFVHGGTTSQGWLGGLTCAEPRLYRTVSNGLFNNAAVWESKLIAEDESSWQPATVVPAKGDDVITIRHNITIQEPTLADQVVITNGSSLQISGSGSLDIFRTGTTPGIIAEQGATLSLAAGCFIYGLSGEIEMKGTLVNSGEITIENILFNGNTAQQLINSNAESFIRKLQVNNAAGITVQGLHRIDVLDLQNGLIHTAANNTLILSDVTGASSSSYINGPVRSRVNYSTRLFPVGKNGAYRPVLLGANSADNEGEAVIEAEVIAGPPTVRTMPATITNVSTVRYYRVSVIANPQNYRDFAITLPYGADDGVTDHSLLKIAKDNGAGGWIDLEGTASGAAPGTIESIRFSSFSDFVLANTVSAPLPVTLLQFRGSLQNNIAALSWVAAQEINFDRYEVQRSSNGSLFETVGSVKAAGVTSVHTYQYNDQLAAAVSVLHYRLKMVDTDGKFRYSSVIELKQQPVSANEILLFPNPFTNRIVLSMYSTNAEKAQVQLIDAGGRIIRLQSWQLQVGANQLYMATADLPNGVYFIKLQTGKTIVTRKIVRE